MNNEFPTYRAPFSVIAGGAGIFLEFRGFAEKGVRLLSVFIDKPSAGVTVSAEKHSANASTDGTPSGGTAVTAVPHTSRQPSAKATVKSWTGAPTGGASLGQVFSKIMATTESIRFSFGEEGGAGAGLPVELVSAAECVSLLTSGAATISGHVEWSEKNL